VPELDVNNVQKSAKEFIDEKLAEIAAGVEAPWSCQVDYRVIDSLSWHSLNIAVNLMSVVPENDPPRRTLPPVLQTDENVPLEFEIGGYDVENDTFSCTIVGAPTARGDMALNDPVAGQGVITPGSTQFQPLTGFSNTTKWKMVFTPEQDDYSFTYNTFTYRLDDSQAFADFTTLIQVRPINDAPVITPYASIDDGADPKGVEVDADEENREAKRFYRKTKEVRPTVGDRFSLKDRGGSITVDDIDNGGAFLEMELKVERGKIDVSSRVNQYVSSNQVSLLSAANDHQRIKVLCEIPRCNKILEALVYVTPTYDEEEEEAASEEGEDKTETNSSGSDSDAPPADALTIVVRDNSHNGGCYIDGEFQYPCNLAFELEIPIQAVLPGDVLPVGAIGAGSGAAVVGAAFAGAATWRNFRKGQPPEDEVQPWLEEGMDIGVTNPLYEESGNKGFNPLYEGDNE